MNPRPPGRLIDLGGFRLHLNATGAGSPTVVLDAALGASSISWALVQPGERPPYVLVGHSFGGLVMRVFAARYRSDVAGLVLVDPAHPEDWVDPAPKERVQIDRGVRLCRQGARAARLGVARVVAALVALGALAPARALVGAASRGGLSRDDEGILAPIWKLPQEARRPLRHFWTQPRFFDALGSQIGSICESAAEVIDAGKNGYGDLPLVTISATGPDDYRLRQQEALARLSTQGRHIVADASGHWIPLDQPDLVTSVVRELCYRLTRDGERRRARDPGMASGGKGADHQRHPSLISPD
jgi:pimeloyl-ACP methyl ester carboxylesterase